MKQCYNEQYFKRVPYFGYLTDVILLSQSKWECQKLALFKKILDFYKLSKKVGQRKVYKYKKNWYF